MKEAKTKKIASIEEFRKIYFSIASKEDELILNYLHKHFNFREHILQEAKRESAKDNWGHKTASDIIAKIKKNGAK